MPSRLAATTTTVLNVHAGNPLPAARVIVVAVPLLALVVFALLRARNRGT